MIETIQFTFTAGCFIVGIIYMFNLTFPSKKNEY